jgi:hypothetical protein
LYVGIHANKITMRQSRLGLLHSCAEREQRVITNAGSLMLLQETAAIEIEDFEMYVCSRTRNCTSKYTPHTHTHVHAPGVPNAGAPEPNAGAGEGAPKAPPPPKAGVEEGAPKAGADEGALPKSEVPPPNGEEAGGADAPVCVSLWM